MAKTTDLRKLENLISRLSSENAPALLQRCHELRELVSTVPSAELPAGALRTFSAIATRFELLAYEIEGLAIGLVMVRRDAVRELNGLEFSENSVPS
jgi:hypothetical protein